MARDRSPSGSRESRFTPTATKTELVTIRSVSAPDLITVGETATVEVSVLNSANFINPFDPDICRSDLAVGGYAIDVELSSGTVLGRKSDCVRGASGVKTYTFEVGPFDSPQNVPLTVTAITSGSYQVVGSRQAELTVVTPPGGGGGGGGDGGGDDGGDGGGGGDGGDDNGGDEDDPSDPDDEDQPASLREFWAGLNQNEKLAVAGGGASLAYLVFRGGDR